MNHRKELTNLGNLYNSILTETVAPKQVILPKNNSFKQRDTNNLFEAYNTIYTPAQRVNFAVLLEQDIDLMAQILIEAGLWDTIKGAASNVAGKVGSAVSSAKSFITDTIVKKLIDLVISKLPKEQLQQTMDIISKGQVTPEMTKEAQGAAQKLQQQPDPAAAAGGQTAAVESYKAYLAQTFLTEEVLLECFKSSQLLTEAKNKRALANLAQQVAAKIQKIYPKNKQAMAAAVPSFTAALNAKLGTSAPAAGGEAPAVGGGAPATPAAGGSPATPAVGGETPAAGNTSKGPGLIKRVMNFIGTYPKVSAIGAAVLIGLIGAAVVGSGGSLAVVGSALAAAAKGAGFAGLANVAQQKVAGKDVDWKQTGKAMAFGAATAGTGSVLMQGLGSIVSGLGNLFHIGGSDSGAAANPAIQSTSPSAQGIADFDGDSSSSSSGPFGDF